MEDTPSLHRSTIFRRGSLTSLSTLLHDHLGTWIQVPLYREMATTTRWVKVPLAISESSPHTQEPERLLYSPPTKGLAHNCSSYRELRGMNHLTKGVHQALSETSPDGSLGSSCMLIPRTLPTLESPCVLFYRAHSLVYESVSVKTLDAVLPRWLVVTRNHHPTGSRHWD